MLTVTELGKQYGGQVLFTEASLQFHAGNRYGVVGANGSGKSTFLRMVAGEETPTEGEIALPKKARVGYLRQDHFLFVRSHLLNRNVALRQNGKPVQSSKPRDLHVIHRACCGKGSSKSPLSLHLCLNPHA